MKHQKWEVWKHDCSDCLEPCSDPWQVDQPLGKGDGETFETWVEAFAWADRKSRGQ